MSDLSSPATPSHSLRVLFIDLTRDRFGWEYALAHSIFDKLKASGIKLASPEIIQPKSDEEYAAIVKREDLQFTALFLLAHGGEDPGDGNVSKVLTPSGKSDWYHLAALTSQCRNKLICLAVCYGSCEDTFQAFINSDLFARVVVASKSKLSSEEANAFFPAFFEELSNSYPSDDPMTIKLCVDNNNHYAHDKMVCRILRLEDLLE